MYIRIEFHFSRFTLSYRLLHGLPLTDANFIAKSFIADETGLDQLSFEEGFAIVDLKRRAINLSGLDFRRRNTFTDRIIGIEIISMKIIKSIDGIAAGDFIYILYISYIIYIFLFMNFWREYFPVCCHNGNGENISFYLNKNC